VRTGRTLRQRKTISRERGKGKPLLLGGNERKRKPSGREKRQRVIESDGREEYNWGRRGKGERGVLNPLF